LNSREAVTAPWGKPALTRIGTEEVEPTRTEKFWYSK